jgi:hypothetical protein
MDFRLAAGRGQRDHAGRFAKGGVILVGIRRFQQRPVGGLQLCLGPAAQKRQSQNQSRDPNPHHLLPPVCRPPYWAEIRAVKHRGNGR